MNRAFLFVCLFAAVLLGIVGFFWVGQAPSNQELLANTAKALDYARGWRSVGGLPWWTPNFLHGSSLAPHLTTAVSMGILLLATAAGGLFAGPKIAALVCIFISVLGVFCWIRRLGRDDRAAAAAAVLYLLSAPLSLRLLHVEHMVFVSAFAVIPWMLLQLTILIEVPSRRNGLVFGAAFALLLITYAKAAGLMFPVAAAYAVAIWLWKHRTWRLPVNSLLYAFLAVLVLGGLIILPAVREMQVVTVFELAPFAGWQDVFSVKSALLWVDRAGVLSQGTAPGFVAASSFGGNYLGIVPILLIGGVLLIRPPGLDASSGGVLFRILLALALLAHWLSFGPRPILLGQFAFLRLAFDTPDLSIAISWALLLVQGWVIFRLFPAALPGRAILASAACVIYFLVPGFRLIGWMPLLSDLRAPQDIVQIAGMYFVAGAAGFAYPLFAGSVRSRLVQITLTPVLLAVALLDVVPYTRKLVDNALPGTVFPNFMRAMTFLAESPQPGTVLPLSGRYFYLLTPHFADRALALEAFNSYLALRGVAFLQMTGRSLADLLPPYLNLGGITWILIDKNDPDTPPESTAGLRADFPVAFENDDFLILKNANSLAPGFVARQFIAGTVAPETVAEAGLNLESSGVIVLPDAPVTMPSQPAKVGTLTDEGPSLDKGFEPDKAPRFTRVDLTAPRTENYHRIAFNPPGQAGWLVATAAFHPDWRAINGETAVPTLPADGALLAAEIANPAAPVVFQFTPPWWYTAFPLAALGGWLALGALLLLHPLLPADFRSRLNAVPHFQREPRHELASLPRPPIAKPIVVIPTYNEIQSLPRTLEKVFASHDFVEVLVVDDGSPDGTGDWVRNHPEFGRRVHLLARRGKLGLGSAYREGFAWAFERGYDACLEMDADLSHDPADIPRLIAGLDEGADAAIGSRYLGGVRVMNWPEGRLFLSTGASKFVRLVTGMPLTDATSGFKALRVSVLRELDWTRFRTEGYGFQVELHHTLWQAGARLVEVPIVFTERRDGQTKMTIGIAVEAAVHTIRLALEKS